MLNGKPALRQALQRLGNARVLNRTSDDVSRGIARETEKCEVVRLGGAAGEDDLVRRGPESRGDQLAGVL